MRFKNYKKKKVCIDVNSIVPFFRDGNLGGVGRSTLELVNAISLVKDEFDFDIELFSQNTKGIGSKSLNLPFKKWHFYFPNIEIGRKLVESLHLKRLLINPDLYHIPHNTESFCELSKTIFTIHDLITYYYPQMWGLTEEIDAELKYIAQNCRAIITCSQASKQDILKFWNIPASKIHVIPWGINKSLFYPTTKLDFLISNHIDKNHYFFCASCNHPRKNLSLLLEAYSLYLEQGGNHQLVLLNPMKELLSGYENLILTNKIVICSSVTDNNLVELYTHAKASVIISLYEGFGLPVLESLACNTAVISSCNSSLMEAGGNVADFLDKVDKKALSQKMLIYDRKKKEETINKQAVENHLSQFTWEKCARETLKIYSNYL